MSGAGKLWDWLSEPRTLGVLALLGGGLAAVVGALWQLYLHFWAPPPSPPVRIEPVAAGPPMDAKALKDYQTSQSKALQAETNALDDVTRQIEAAGSASGSKSKPSH